MKWVTRRSIRVNRTATAWLVRRFVDQDAEFLFVDPDDAQVRAAKAAGVRHSAGKGQRALRSGIVATEIALALALTVGAGLMLRSYLKMEGTDLGFEPKNLRMFELHFPAEKYRGREDATQLPGQLLERIRAHPGVEVAAVTSQSPANIVAAVTNRAGVSTSSSSQWLASPVITGCR